ncbi:hypothetical protein DFH29DRAFT_881459 [Suillus ampliporus]|nr:hypothetical protein DFH29DRAFT_881459 [Suillus ampliporus]
MNVLLLSLTLLVISLLLLIGSQAICSCYCLGLKWLYEFNKDIDLGMQHLVCTTIYGPAAAGSPTNDGEDGKYGRGKSKCTMYGLMKVTPQLWAWAMCVAWFLLCSCNSYKLIISLFNLKHGDIQIDQQYYRQVFGKHAAKAMMTTSNDADSDLVKIWAKYTTCKQGAFLTSATSTASAPPCSVTLPRLLSLAPSSPLSGPSSPIFLLFLKQGSATTEPTPTTQSMPTHPKLLPPKVIPKPKPILVKQKTGTYSSTHLATSDIQVEEPENSTMEAPVTPKKKAYGRKAA